VLTSLTAVVARIFAAQTAKYILNYKAGEKFSQAQQYIIELYNCHKMLIIFILRHVSTLY
jgi:hypothetical protein